MKLIRIFVDIDTATEHQLITALNESFYSIYCNAKDKPEWKQIYEFVLDERDLKRNVRAILKEFKYLEFKKEIYNDIESLVRADKK